jgi:cell division initiation protein
MKYSADDITNQHFERSFRGYNAEQVGEFLDGLAQEWRRMQQELNRLQSESEEQARELRDWRKRERDLLDALATTRDMTEELRSKAEDNAQRIRQEATERAERTVQGALDRKLQVEAEITALEQRQRGLHTDLRRILTDHLSLLGAEPGAATPAGPPAAPPLRRAPTGATPTLKVRASELASWDGSDDDDDDDDTPSVHDAHTIMGM